ncbi:hypothetical protein COV20_03520 [Candidatus Woesearchaeota archaeon CG10_big_fil_rev_8_21_14_0_10_45_16]|nr:MAG: hypothetical protein COV20_03520 [Candidatus Woesearchaeota archaeon CG10_big_fil_rev_8_21_14_0_10_45_16]
MRSLIYDIDNTLTPTTKHYFRELHRLLKHPKPVEELIANHELVEHVPEWQSHPQFGEEFQKLLYCGVTHAQLPPIEGSQAAVWNTHSRTPTAGYLTARPHTLTEVTEIWLRTHGFPIEWLPAYHRPADVDAKDANAWKADFLVERFPEIGGIADDSRGLPRELKKRGYRGKVFIVGSAEHPLQDEEHYIPCPTLDHILDHIKRSA